MYKPDLIPLFAFAVIALLQSCKKDPAENLPLPSTTLSAIEWSPGNQKETYEYNSDRSLKKIVFTSGQVADSYEFKWNDKKLSEVHETGSLFKQYYQYSGNRISTMTYAPAADPGVGNYKMAYTYRADGKPDKMELIMLNASGSNAVTTYNYNAAGELSSTVTIMDEYRITQTIESYSAEVRFEPWSFIDISLLENYMIYNYPVLSSMKALPAKVSRSVKIGNNPEFLDAVTTNTFEITNGRISKLKYELQIPGSPSLNRTKNAQFIYK
ncbi:MAG: hypothetical protein DI535_15375 [Citrobacter freundii]|nr:MAG: hypothetical protein DI535_15375 [Citrobacter freundii]